MTKGETFEITSKQSEGYSSETHVKRGRRIFRNARDWVG